jgi:hypothetical protein
LQKKLKEYLLRGIDPELYTGIKHFCLDEGITVKEFMLKAIEHYFDDIKRDLEEG